MTESGELLEIMQTRSVVPELNAISKKNKLILQNISDMTRFNFQFFFVTFSFNFHIAFH